MTAAPTAPATRQEIWSIQYLRAMAAIAVIVFHQFQDHDPLFKLGAHGVDIFFVISGFIMVALTDGRNITAGRFMRDRIARIVPLYWLALLLAFLCKASGMQVWGMSDDPLLLLKSLLFIPADNGHGDVFPTLYLGWTLNYEMFFYALFALTLLMRASLALPALGLCFFTLVAVGSIVPMGGAAASIYTNPLLIEFFAGACLGRIFGIGLDRHSRLATIGLSLLVAILLIALGFLLGRIPAGGAAVALVATLLMTEREGAMPRIGLLKRLGDASFSIYLLQQFAFDFLSALWRRAEIWSGVEMSDLTQGLIATLAAILLGLVAHRWIERPLTAATRRWLAAWFHRPARLRQT